MFYSHDILGRRGPLGFIWSMAHGKRLSKHKLLGISLSDICQQILAPDVPHSLRLQGILMGGVALVFARQQMYLLEDMQEMTRHVKEATSVAAVHTAGGTTATLKKNKEKAKTGAITMENGDFDLDLGHTAIEDAMLLTMPDAMLDMADDEMRIFLVPSVPAEPTPQGSFLASAAKDDDQRRFEGDSSDEELQGLPPAPRLPPAAPHLAARPTLALPKQRAPRSQPALSIDDEMFQPMEETMMMELMGEEPEFAPPPASPLSEIPLVEAHPALEPLSPEALVEADELLAPEGQRTPGTPPGSRSDGGGDKSAARTGDVSSQGPEESQPGQPAQQAQEGGTNAAPKAKAGPGQARAEKSKSSKGRSHKGAPTITDDLEDLQIRVAVYRQWTQDTSNLLRAPGARSGRAGLAPGERRSPDRPSFMAPYVFGKCPALPRTELCRRLAQLYAFCLRTDAAADQAAAGTKRKRSPAPRDEPLPAAQQQRSDHSPAAAASKGPSGSGLEAGLSPAPLQQMSGPHAANLNQGMDLDPDVVNQGMDLDLQLTVDPDHMYGSVDLETMPEAAGIEMERLRAVGNTPNGSVAFRVSHLGLDSGSTKVPLSTNGSSRATTATTNTSNLSPESENGLRMPRHRLLRPSNPSLAGQLSPIHDHDMVSDGLYFGEGMLEDLLPAVPEVDRVEEGAQLQERAQFEAGAAAAQLGSAPVLPASDPLSSKGQQRFSSGITQFNLLESSGLGTQPPELISKSTLVVTEIFRHRLALAREQQQQQQGAADGGAAEHAPEVSFFNLVNGIKRSEAVKLFYQVLVTHSAGVIHAKQSEPFGDIRLSAGRLI